MLHCGKNKILKKERKSNKEKQNQQQNNYFLSQYMEQCSKALSKSE